MGSGFQQREASRQLEELCMRSRMMRRPVLGWREGVVGPQGFAWGQIMQIWWGGIKLYPGATQRDLEEKISNKTRIKAVIFIQCMTSKGGSR